MPAPVRTLIAAAFGLVLLSATGAPATAQGIGDVEAAADHRFRIVEVTGGLDRPWSLAFLPDGRMLVTERGGDLRWIDTQGRLMPRPIAGVPAVADTGQGGLLDVVPHPEFGSNGWIYLSYAYGSLFGTHTAIARGRLAGDRLTDIDVLVEGEPTTMGGRHFGSRLAFGPDGHLYITIGDRGRRDEAQSLQSHNGTVLRLRDDGSVPADNPFVGRADALPEVYSYGHRNAQGIAVQPGSGLIWLHEHGPRGGDEVNIVAAGVNYGWPVITYGEEYRGGRIGIGTRAEGMAQPVSYWTPSIAPSGMAFYAGDAFPAWQGDLLVGALVGQHLARLDIDGQRVVGEEKLLDGLRARIRDVRVGPDGLIYLLTDAAPGSVLRLEPVD